MLQLHTERLLLRDVTPADLNDIHQLHSLPETDRYNTMGIPDNIETTRTFLTNWLEQRVADPITKYVFCIELIDTQKFIGLIALNIALPKYSAGEAWYKLHSDHWGNGYATEALKQILNFGFNELGLHRIEAGCAVDNTASRRVIEKAGMIREGMKRENLPIRGNWYDGYLYAILDSDYKKLQPIMYNC